MVLGIVGIPLVVLAGNIIEAYHFNTGTISSGGTPAAVATLAPPGVPVLLPSSGTEPFFLTPAANSMETGPYGLLVTSSQTNIIKRGGMDSCAGPNINGWLKSGSGSVACSSTHRAHGMFAGRLQPAGSGGTTALQQCVNIDNTKQYYTSSYWWGSAENESCRFFLSQYDAANCTGSVVQNIFIIPADTNLPAGWTQYSSTIAAAPTGWHASALSVKIFMSCNPSSSGLSIYTDLFVLQVTDQPTDSACVCDTDLDCTCTSTIASIPTDINAATWRIEATVRSPIDGAVATPARYIWHTPGTSGDNNKISLYQASDVLTFDVYSSAGALTQVTVAAAWAAGTDYGVRASHAEDGLVEVCWWPLSTYIATCSTQTAGATMAEPNATTYLGSDGTTVGEIYIKDLVLYRSLAW